MYIRYSEINVTLIDIHIFIASGVNVVAWIVSQFTIVSKLGLSYYI